MTRIHFFYFSQIFSFFLTFYFDSFSPPNCFPPTIFHFLVCSLISHYFQRSSPLFDRFISMFSSPPLPPPLFHPKHISQPPPLYFISLHLPPLSLPVSSLSSCPHIAITLLLLPSALISLLPVLSLSSLPNSSFSLSSNVHASSLLQCVCVYACVFGARSAHTPIGYSPFILNDSTDRSGQKTSRRQRCTPPSYCLSYHCRAYGCTHILKQTASPGPPDTNTHTHTHRHGLS